MILRAPGKPAQTPLALFGPSSPDRPPQEAPDDAVLPGIRVPRLPPSSPKSSPHPESPAFDWPVIARGAAARNPAAAMPGSISRSIPSSRVTRVSGELEHGRGSRA